MSPRRKKPLSFLSVPEVPDLNASLGPRVRSREAELEARVKRLEELLQELANAVGHAKTQYAGLFDGEAVIDIAVRARAALKDTEGTP